MNNEFLGEPKQIFIANYMVYLARSQDNLAWFALRDNIANMLLSKFLLGGDNESSRIFDLYNVCHRILLNQELVYDHISVERLLELCPTENWREIVGLEIELYEANDPRRNQLDLLKDLKRETFLAFRNCEGFANFRRHVMTGSARIASLLSDVYNEIYGIHEE